ncbi:hypothetical protein PCANC_00587 [Puccinia coronata f. sp. avenae]|uniref:Uncharacterized protein n=1 Tax=Puccinia coronata f. sp. avenae TaxID=200324 RepID=A0A2N5W847_9BASI|nr:hypothetical protein PCASD_02886 [Puccinia coronata f. sp. avenae]PLW58420.1 hypothetical protein PCANC_00587 [Puccinia coronata f. sp. avenae]
MQWNEEQPDCCLLRAGCIDQSAPTLNQFLLGLPATNPYTDRLKGPAISSCFHYFPQEPRYFFVAWAPSFSPLGRPVALRGQLASWAQAL